MLFDSVSIQYCKVFFVLLLTEQGAYNSRKPGKLREFLNSGKLGETQGISNLLGNFCKCNCGH